MAIYGHNFDMFIGKFYHGASKTVADLTAAAADTTEFAIELSTGYLADTTALTTGDKFRVVQIDTQGNLQASPYILFDNITKGAVIEHGDASNGTGYLAENDQVSNVGYGQYSTGHAIEAINSNRYTLRMNFLNDGEIYSEQKDQHFFEYVSDASAKSIEVANHFAQKMSAVQFLADGSINGPKRSRVAVLRQSSVTKVATAGDITFTRGSKTATLQASTDFSALAAGVYVGVGVNDLGLAAANTFYKIEKIVDNNTTKGYIVLDQPYQGISETIGEGTSTSTVGYVTAANMEAATVGLTITGLDQYHKAGLYPYHKVVFDVTLDGWGTTQQATTETAVKGDTVGEAIADLEWFALSKNSPGGASFNGTGFPSAEMFAETKADAAQPYDIVSFDYVMDPVNGNAIAGGGKIKGSVVMALPGDADSLQDHLNDVVVNIDGITDILAAS